MKIKKIEKYDKPSIPKRNEFLSSKNIVSVISVGLLTFTISCSSNAKIVEEKPNSVDSIATNYPNPFMPTTTIKYAVNHSDKTGRDIEINIYDSEGNIVRNLFNEIQSQGEYTLSWDGKDNQGDSVESGVFFYKVLIDNNTVETKKMIILK